MSTESGVDRASAPAGAAPAPVTVVIPVHDRSDLLAAALDSVAAQTAPPAAVIVVDDGSADDSGAVAAARGATVIRHDAPRGPGAARNAGIAASGTPWVAFLDSDDLWAPDHLAGLLAAARPGAVLVTAPCTTTAGRWWGNARGREAPLDVTSLLIPGDGIVTSGTMVRRDEALAVGGFPETVWHAEDLGLWLRLLRRGPGVQTARPTVRYLVHDVQLSESARRMREAHEAVVAAEAADWLTPSRLAQHRSRQVWDALREAERARDLRGVLAGLAFYGRHPAALRALALLVAHRRRTRRALEGLSASSGTSFPVGRSED